MSAATAEMSNMREIIAIDADDSLFNENKAIRLFMNDKYGFTHTEADYSYEGEYWGYWERIWGLPPEEAERAYQAFLVSDYKRNLEPLPHAHNVLSRLQSHFDFALITSRDEPHVQMTHMALQQDFPGIFKVENVFFVPLWDRAPAGEKTTKATILQAIGAKYLIDDSYEHCKGVAATGREALLFGNTGWNRAQQLLPHMTRVFDWLAVEKYFDGK